MTIMMIRKFLRDERGGYALMTAAAIVPIMGALALAVDYTEMSKQRQETLNALDAAGIATARRIVEGATDEEAKTYAKQFFEANLGSVEPGNATLTVLLPNNNAGGGTLKLAAALKYKPFFFPTFASLIGKAANSSTLDFSATAEIRLKNTLEVALVLDNSGSMSETGTGSGKKRIDLLKDASKQLVDTIAGQAALMKQVSKPVQFGVVPFAASVNVGPENADASWMDAQGLSPFHHENFDWATLTDPNKKAELVGGAWYKKGTGWGDEEGDILSRFSLYKDMKQVSSREWVSTGQEWICTHHKKNGTCDSGYWQQTGYYDETISSYASWQGCVEARPNPLNVNDTSASTSDPKSLFVPMFGPDEPGDRWWVDGQIYDNLGAINNWWNDHTESSSSSTRQKNMTKYFVVRPYGATSAQGTGPNYSCTTMPITPLTDVSDTAGQTAIKAAIDKMTPNGATNVPEGMAWGWRVVSSGAPFTGGRPETEKGNDKVVIVLTDGANTYYTPGSLGASDPASNKSTYSAYAYAGRWPSGYTTSRIFQGTTVSATDYSNGNYTKAQNEQFKQLCDNAKANNLMVMTVSLDLDASNTTAKAQMDALKECSSDSRFRKDSAGKPVKLYWNATGGSLSDTFKDIANELSNLRIVG
jgi:Flp pilus assembly protein TadG